MEQWRNELRQASRIVVKVGSSSLTHPTGKLNYDQLEKLVRQIADMQNQGKEVILVSSGAVGAGMGKLGLKNRPKSMPEKQAVAAIGQGLLMHMYEKFFAEYGVVVAQVLLTRDDISERKRFLNAKNTLHTLIQLGVIPIINENDTVANEELKFGDNDTLSALVASLVEADLLILLSDIDGVYTANPRTNKDAKLIDVIEDITPEIFEAAGGAGSGVGTGGMVTKLQAGKIAVCSGVAMVIADSFKQGVLKGIIAGESIGTLFYPGERKLENRKRWIAFGSQTFGELMIDEGALKALGKGKSLLPSGIIHVTGVFEEGNVIVIKNINDQEIGRGITNYSSKHIELILGKQCNQIEDILGVKDYDEVIHRNNMVLA